METFFHEHFNRIEPEVTLVDLIIIVQDHGEFIKSYTFDFRTLKTKCTSHYIVKVH